MAEETKALVFKPQDYRQPQSLDVLQKMGRGIQAAIAEAMPTFLRKQAPALLKSLYTCCQTTPKLLECTPESLFGATIMAAQMGLMLGGALGQAYLIPFKRRATLVPGYKGLIQLVNRSGRVGVISAMTVYDKDGFKRMAGTTPGLLHEPYDYKTLEEVKGRQSMAYYAVCQTKNGCPYHYMTKAECEYHRERFALARPGPWWDHFDAMSMKTCIRYLCKYLPMSAEVQTAIYMDEMAETDNPVDASFLFQEIAGGEPESSEQQSKHDDLRKRLETRKADAEPEKEGAKSDKLASLLGELDALEGTFDFCGKHDLADIASLEATTGKVRKDWIAKLEAELRTIAAKGIGGIGGQMPKH